MFGMDRRQVVRGKRLKPAGQLVEARFLHVQRGIGFEHGVGHCQTRQVIEPADFL